MSAAADDAHDFAVPSETLDARPGSAIMRPVEAIAATLLVLIIGMLLTGVVSRYVFARPIFWIDEASSIAFLWLAMLGSAIAIDRSEHLRLTLFLTTLSDRRRQFAETLGMVLMATFLLTLLPAAWEYVVGEMDITSSALNIPVGYRVSAIAVGMVLMLGLLIVAAAVPLLMIVWPLR